MIVVAVGDQRGVRRMIQFETTTLWIDVLPPDARPTDPTPAQIREACLEYQRHWTESERQRRSIAKPCEVNIRVAADEQTV